MHLHRVLFFIASAELVEPPHLRNCIRSQFGKLRLVVHRPEPRMTGSVSDSAGTADGRRAVGNGNY